MLYIERYRKDRPHGKKIDLFKLIYQRMVSVNHWTGNQAEAISEEIKHAEESEKAVRFNKSAELYEFISDDTVRVNLFPFRDYFPTELLLHLFSETAKRKGSGNVKELIAFFHLERLYQRYKASAPHHSVRYHHYYYPCYRIVFFPLIPVEVRARKLQLFLDGLPKDAFHIIALEGRCCSGKTTIAGMLTGVRVIATSDYAANGFESLDFDYLERLLKSLKQTKKKGQTVVLEGVYSYHPRFRKYCDGIAFVVTDKKTQEKRMGKRCNCHDLKERLPREEEYFTAFPFVLKADILI